VGKTMLVTVVMAAAGGLLGLDWMRAQAPTAPTLNPDDTNLLHTDAVSRPKFQSATIKPSKDQSPGPPSIDAAPQQFTSIHSSLKDLVRFAYHAKSTDQIVGGPSWINTKFFDIDAKASASDVSRMFEHNGGMEGFNGEMEYYPEDGVTVIVLSNVNGSAPGRTRRGTGIRGSQMNFSSCGNLAGSPQDR